MSVIQSAGSENQGDQPAEIDKRLRLEEYKLLLDGYRYRDILIPQEFQYMLQTLFLFSVLLTGSQTLAPLPIASLLSLLICGAGCIALCAFTVDIHANTSCKRRLREAAKELERSDSQLRYWKLIESRDPLLMDRNSPRAVASWTFALAALFLLGIWTLVSLAVALFGQNLLPKA